MTAIAFFVGVLCMYGICRLAGWFGSDGAKPQAESVKPAEPDRIIWGQTCFAEFSVANGDQPWVVQKYGSDWLFYLSNEADVVTLIDRLDQYERQQARIRAVAL